MSDVATPDQQLNQMILNGKILEAFEQFYADGVVMQENAEEPRVGKPACREFEKQFLANVEQFHGAKLGAAAASGDVSFSEWEFDMTFKGGQRVKSSQVAVRKWKDGKIIHERFYYNAANK